MSRADTLPIFLSTYKLVLEIYKTTPKFDKNYKYSLGQDVQKDALQLLQYIYQANRREVKMGELEDFMMLFEKVRIQVRLARDLNQISIKKLAHLSLMAEDINKQASAWLKHERRKQGKKEEIETDSI